jgi:DNA polymerase-3 subunit gamma/tau
MAYTALYRKLRPQLFSDVVGQAAIIQTLKNQLRSGRISHAYLFCGTRGTGKTSTAKIFAKAANCPNASGGEPCNVCDICVGIQEQRSLEVVEIDAASNNGVDNVRDIREEVKYPPAEGKYKVYIIDEVHMMSNSAFNALLKTLEEPPPHVIFILATTDPQKLPATILSRCQRFDFKRIGSQDMVKSLKEHLAQERVTIEDDALRYIAGVSDGAMRDALSLADQCISFYFEEDITLEKVLNLLGAADPGLLHKFAQTIIDRDAAGAIEMIHSLIMDGKDATQFAADMVQHFRNLLVAASVEKKTLALDYSDERVARFRSQGKQVPGYLLISYINSFSSLLSEMKYAANPRIMLEVATVKLCSPARDDSLTEVLMRLSQVEEQVKEKTGGLDPAVLAKFEEISKRLDSQAVEDVIERKAIPKPAAQQPKPPPQAVPEDMQKIIMNWGEIVKDLSEPLGSILRSSRVEHQSGRLQIMSDNPSSLGFIRPKLNELKEKILDKYLVEVEITVKMESEGKADNDGVDFTFSQLQKKIPFRIEGL